RRGSDGGNVAARPEDRLRSSEEKYEPLSTSTVGERADLFVSPWAPLVTEGEPAVRRRRAWVLALRFRDLAAASLKLEALGVHSACELLWLVEDGSLNDRLEAAGHRRFAAATLAAVRAVALEVGLRPARRAAATPQGAGASAAAGPGVPEGVEEPHDDDPMLLQRQIQQGLERLGVAVAEAGRREAAAARGLRDAEATAARLAELRGPPK
ncbi:unnamed protein product, partial [Prorocentrum cordatum]